MNAEKVEIKESEKEDYLPFGWKIIDVYSKRVSRLGRRTIIVLERDKDQKNYQELASLQNKYKNLQGQIETYQEMDELVTILLYLLFIIPGILYTVYKTNQKKEIITNNYIVRSQMDGIKKKAEALREN